MTTMVELLKVLHALKGLRKEEKKGKMTCTKCLAFIELRKAVPRKWCCWSTNASLALTEF